MAPPKRKLHPEPDPCAAACDAIRNPYRSCPPPCIPFCPAFCQPEFFLPPPPPPPIHHHRYHYLYLLSPAFIAIFALLASAFVIVISYLLYSRLSSSGRAPPRRQLSSRAPEFDPSMDVLNFHPAWYIATVGLQRSAIESIAVCEYKTGDGLVQGTGCSVCLAEFRDGDALRLLPKCCHAFHVPCIDTWLASRTTCPVCRAPVLPANSSFRPDKARIVEIVGSLSSTGEVGSSNSGEFDAEMVDEREEAPMRRAASMGSLCVELGEKLNSSSSSSSGCNSLVERSHSCTGKLFSSTRNGLR